MSTQSLSDRLRATADDYMQSAFIRLRHPAGTPQAALGVKVAVVLLHTADSYLQAAQENEGKDTQP